MEAEKVRNVFKKALGTNYQKLSDTYVLEYLISKTYSFSSFFDILGIIKEFDLDKKDFEASISPFLDDVDIDKEDQRDILNELWAEMGFNTRQTSKQVMQLILHLQL
jgi:hypothetical protein